MQHEDNIIDLGKVIEHGKAAAEIEDREQRERAIRALIAWDRGMNRAFKGIFPRSRRRKWMGLT